MSTFRSGNMSGARVKTPLLLLLLLLLSSLTGTVLCQYGDEQVEDQADEEVQATDDAADSDTPAEQTEGEGDASATPEHVTTPHTDPPSTTVVPAVTDAGLDEGSGSGDDDGTADGETGGGELSTIIIMVPVVLVVLIIAMIVCGIFINRRWNTKVRKSDLRKEDPYLDGSSTEKVPMPMFEEDVPSVLELEMEELDQWMKKDGETAEDSKKP